MRRHLVLVLLALCVVELVAVLFYRAQWKHAEAALGPADSARIAWEATADSATVVAKTQIERAEQSYQTSVQVQEWADSTVNDADAQLEAVRARVAEIQARPARVSLIPDLAARDSAIAQYEKVVVTMRHAYNRQQAANAQLRIALMRMRMAYDTVATTLTSRPKPRGEWSPRFRAGGAIDTDGALEAGLTMQLSHVVVFAGVRDGRKYGRLGLSFGLF